MLIVGTDRMTVVGSAAAPHGTWHAVDDEGRVLCRASRSRFAWPALRWEEHRGQQEACSLCAQVRIAQEALSQVPAYPIGPEELAAPSTPVVPGQPHAGLFESDAS